MKNKKYLSTITAFFLFFGMAFSLPMSSYFSYEEPLEEQFLVKNNPKTVYPVEEFIKDKIFNSENKIISFFVESYDIVKYEAEIINQFINEGYDLTETFWLSPENQALILNKDGLRYEKKIFDDAGIIEVKVDEKARFYFHLAVAF